jgi:protein-disulfide isomerase
MQKSVFLALTAALTLGLASCGKSEKAGEAPSGEPVAKIAAPAGKAWEQTVVKTPEGGYRMGNPEAPIKLVEYGSLSCPGCARLAIDGFQKLTSDYVASGRVSFEFRSYAIHPQDVPLTVLAGCGAPEAFIPLAEQLYTNFDAVSAATQQGAERAQQAMQLPDNQRFVAMADAMGFTEFFAQRGVSRDQANACLSNIAAASDVAARAEQYSKDGVTGTPTLVINGAKIAGSSWAELEAALQRAGAR